MAKAATTGISPRPDLADQFFEYDVEMNRMGFVATQVFPMFDVPQQNGEFLKVEIKELLKNQIGPADPGYALARRNDGTYVQVRRQFTKDTFATEEFGEVDVLDDRESNIYSTFEHESLATSGLLHDLMREMEIRVAAIAFDTNVFTATYQQAVGTAWSTHATATPVENFRAAREKMFDNCGRYPNACVMNERAFGHLIQTAEIRDRYKGEGAGDPDRTGDMRRDVSTIASILNIGEIIIAGGAKDSAAIDAAVTPAHIWGKSCLLFVRNTDRNLRAPQLGRTFHWSGDGSMENGVVEEWSNPEVRGRKIRARHEVQHKLLNVIFGMLIPSVYA